MDVFTLNYGILDGITVVLLRCKNKEMTIHINL